MSQRSIWDVLGIEATDDERELKRAYARRLKLTHPEDDPEGFQELRAAYDLAQRRLLYRRQEAYEAAVEAARQAPEPVEADEPAPIVEIVHPLPNRQETEKALPPAQAAVVEIVQPLPDRPMTEEERFNAAFQAEVDALHEDVAEMRAMLQASPVPTISVRQKFEVLLASPALDNLAVAGGFEPWIEEVLIADLPASDLLIPLAIDHFGWTPDEDRRFRRVGDMALARENDLLVLRQLGRRSHSQNAAFRALTAPPTRWNRLRWQATVGLEERVMGLLSGIQTDRPGLIQNLDAQAVAWWEASATRPRIGLAAFLGLIAFPLAALLLFAPDRWTIWWPASLAASAVLGGVYFYGVARPRIAWRTGAGDGAANWKRYGWAMGALSLPLLGAVLLPSGIDLGLASLLLWALGLGFAGWARVTGEPAFPRPKDRLVALVGFHRTLRALLRFGYLAAFWFVISVSMADDRWLLMLVAGLGSILVFVTGAGSLQALIERVGKEARKPFYLPGLVALPLLAALACAAGTQAQMMPWLAVLAGAVGLMEITLDRVLDDDQLVRRAWLAVPIWFGCWIVNTVIDADTTSVVGVFGSWLLLLSAMTLWQAMRADAGKSQKAGL